MSRKSLLFAMVLLSVSAAAPALGDAAFQQWLASLWPDAKALGVSRATFEAATRGLEPDLALPDLVLPGRPKKLPAGQPEFVQTPADYIREPAIERLAADGRKLYAQYRAPLDGIEKQFGVPPTIVLAIFGRESDYGRAKDTRSAIQVLATQAYVGKRKDKFRQEFLLALKILEDGHIKLADMKSSWAGAMGLTQFLPSEYYKYGVDFEHKGRVDIWTSVPDALASAAKQLVGEGWQRDKPWAYEVRVPANVDCTVANPDQKMPLAEWLKRGFVLANGRKPRPRDLNEPASLLLPAGIYGPGFLIFHNYFALKEYNFSDLYVLFVGHLADRIAGERAFETPWQNVAQLKTADLERMQRVLTARGFYQDKIDGKAGMKTRLALGAFQKANGLKLDCWPTAEVLSRMGN